MAKRKNYYQKKNRKTKLGRIEGIIATVLVVAAAIAYFIYDQLPAQPLPGDGVSVHFIDVGQGDSTLIQYDGHNILIDAGENDQGDVVVDYLKSQGVDKLDLMIGSHPHSDHIGGMDTVLKAFDAETILMPELSKENTPTTKTYLEVLSAAEQQGKTITAAAPGQTFTYGQAKVSIVGPVQEYNDLNSNSVVAKFSYGDTSFLFGGDMEAQAEQDLLESDANVKSTVLKLSHHGSNTSNSQDFLDAVQASDYVICVGSGNSYGHPHQEILDRIAGKSVYRTDLNGTIVFHSDGANLTVTTER
ncbi:ComEC/Rec2 family competence protein [Massilioclostridium coli]|uniref:ComEC/Rec2 family competence protein n=1 Tax=Massilioclostridium coli TaxID=1870991 RepID=UPI0022E720A2|nr:MBL fold metallo-hydrolase [Massilioclostridium coli]